MFMMSPGRTLHGTGVATIKTSKVVTLTKGYKNFAAKDCMSSNHVCLNAKRLDGSAYQLTELGGLW